jgi:hypothetical protein
LRFEVVVLTSGKTSQVFAQPPDEVVIVHTVGFFCEREKDRVIILTDIIVGSIQFNSIIYLRPSHHKD